MENELNKARKGLGEIIEKFLAKLDEAVTNFKASNVERPDELKMMAATLREFVEIERLENDKPTKIFGYEELSRHNIKDKIQNLINLGIPIGDDLEALVKGDPMPMTVDPKDMN